MSSCHGLLVRCFLMFVGFNSLHHPALEILRLPMHIYMDAYYFLENIGDCDGLLCTRFSLMIIRFRCACDLLHTRPNQEARPTICIRL